MSRATVRVFVPLGDRVARLDLWGRVLGTWAAPRATVPGAPLSCGLTIQIDPDCAAQLLALGARWVPETWDAWEDEARWWGEA